MFPNLPTIAWTATLDPGYHSFSKWAITCMHIFLFHLFPIFSNFDIKMLTITVKWIVKDTKSRASHKHVGSSVLGNTEKLWQQGYDTRNGTNRKTVNSSPGNEKNQLWYVHGQSIST